MLYQIQTAFADLDAQMLERQTEWAMERFDELAAARKDGRFADLDVFERGARLVELAGGKKWYEQITGGNKQMLAEFVAKNVAAIIEKRNARIVAALTKQGITEIPAFTLYHHGNGYEGFFKVAGHQVTIHTIIAGGYNIQCLHERTLIKAKAAA